MSIGGLNILNKNFGNSMSTSPKQDFFQIVQKVMTDCINRGPRVVTPSFKPAFLNPKWRNLGDNTRAQGVVLDLHYVLDFKEAGLTLGASFNDRTLCNKSQLAGGHCQ